MTRVFLSTQTLAVDDMLLTALAETVLWLTAADTEASIREEGQVNIRWELVSAM